MFLSKSLIWLSLLKGKNLKYLQFGRPSHVVNEIRGLTAISWIFFVRHVKRATLCICYKPVCFGFQQSMSTIIVGFSYNWMTESMLLLILRCQGSYQVFVIIVERETVVTTSSGFLFIVNKSVLWYTKRRFVVPLPIQLDVLL